MSQQPDAKTVSALASVLVVMLALLMPVLYALSIGPACWLAKHGYLSDDERSPAHLFYTPLIWLHERVPMTQNALERYVELWD